MLVMYMKPDAHYNQRAGCITISNESFSYKQGIRFNV